MWQRGVHAEYRGPARAVEYFWDQAAEFNAARLRPAAAIASSPRYVKRVTGQIPVGAEEAAGALPKIRDDNDFGLVISGAGFHPRFPLAHVVGCSKVCIAVTAPNF